MSLINSSGRYLIVLPWIYIVLIPVFLAYNPITSDSNSFYSYFAIVIASILLIWNGVELFFVFILRKTNPKKSQNALDCRQIIKYAAYMSIIFLVFSVSFDILITQKIVPLMSGTIEQSHTNSTMFISGSLFAMLFSIIPYLPILTNRNFARGQSFAHFQAGLKTKKLTWKIENYQLGIEDYDRYLGEILGVKFKQIDKIHSSIIVEKISTLDSKIRELLESFNDPIIPAKILSSRIESKAEDFFETIKPYEHLEKWLKYLTPLIPIIPASIYIYFQYNPPNILSP